jgi:ribonuclease HII
MQKGPGILERVRLEKMSLWENRARQKGFLHVAGVDEAGRGPLAGPVVAAACVFPDGAALPGIDDSKKLLPLKRFEIFQELMALEGIDYGIGIIDAFVIDQVNILQATFQAMLAAIARLKKAPDYLLVDGNRLPGSAIPGEAVVKGDSLSVSIAAASIIAKVTRDQIMQTFHRQWPYYGFDLHKGYPTRAHVQAIRAHGPSPIHRMSFEPLKSLERME